MHIPRLGSPKRVYVPKNGRRPVVVDEWFTIVRRKKLGAKLRQVLFAGSPPKVVEKRLDTWAWLVKEFVHLRDFRYVELLHEARLFLKEVGQLQVEGDPEEYDLLVLKAYQRYLYRRRRELQTWRNREVFGTPEHDAEMAAAEAKSLALYGICFQCGNDTPCEQCQVPAVALDGRGGIVAI